MPELWMPGAQRLDIGDHAPTDGGPAKAVAHITWDKNASAAKPIDLVPYENLKLVLLRRRPRRRPPHPVGSRSPGASASSFPANSRSKSLVDQAGGTRTNRAGSVVIQIEALFFPYCRVGGRAYARLADTPCKGWQQLQDWVHSWGVPNVWPMGRPTDFVPHRSESAWETQGGWYGHSQVPENTHQDPGSWPAFVETTPSKPPTPATKPRVSLKHVVYAAQHDPAAAAGPHQLQERGPHRGTGSEG
jgi:hypothetical protein